MKTRTEAALERVRSYFEQHPEAKQQACKDANIQRSTMDTALNPLTNPKIATIVKLDEVIPKSFRVSAGKSA